MKKLFYLLLVPLAFLMSCSDDNDVKEVNMTLTLSGVTQYDNTFYTVVGENIVIDSFTAKAENGKDAGFANVVYYLNGMPLDSGLGVPFDGVISTENLTPGTYTLSMAGKLLVVDSSVMNFAASYKIVVVESQEDLPANAPEIGTYSQTVSIGG